ncbi:MAG: AI-2E family transporter [Pyrinomonadaceae bacterium]
MPQNNISDAANYVSDKTTEEIGLTAERNANLVVLDPSTPSIRSITRVVLITLLLLFFAGFVQNILASMTYLFFLIVLSVFFAYLIEPLIQLIRRPFENAGRDKYMPRTLAIATAYLLVFSVLGITIASLTPIVVEQARQLSINLPVYASSIQESFRDLSTRYKRYQIPEAVQEQINEKAAGLAGAVGTEVSDFFIASVFYLPWLILVPVLAFFFLKDANLFRVSLLRIFPVGDWRARIESVMTDVNETLAAYTRAQLISCILIGTICTVGFYILGLDYAVLLGVLAGVLEFIPLIGPITIAITAIIAASLESVWQAVYVFIFLGVLRILQDYVFYPRIIREGIHLHPLAIILSVLAGEQVAGIPGVFLSIPLMALLTVVYKHVLEHSGSKGIVANILAPKENSEEEGAAVEDSKSPT